jgi:hypothetical protein
LAYGTLVLGDGTKIIFELDEEFKGPCGFDDIAETAKHDFEEIMKLIRELALNAQSSFLKMPNEAMPSEYTLSFGIKLSASAGVVFAKTGAEGNFQITLKWTASK